MKAIIIIMAGLISTAALAQGKGKAEGPCKQIEEACLKAGFKQGDWKNGDGLWRDCIDPIVQGVTNVPGATKPLPQVDPQAVANCKAKHPKYGAGKVGSTPNAPKK